MSSWKEKTAEDYKAMFFMMKKKYDALQKRYNNIRKYDIDQWNRLAVQMTHDLKKNILAKKYLHLHDAEHELVEWLDRETAQDEMFDWTKSHVMKSIAKEDIC